MEVTRRLLVAIAVIVLMVFPVAVWAQGSYGGITGRVTDASGAAVSKATVLLTNLGTGVSATASTTDDGIYRVSLPSGAYRITATDPGFRTFVQEPIVITTATVVTLNVSLTVGNVSQTVEVTTPEVQLQTTSAEIGTSMPEQAMLDLPISLGGAATTGASGRRQIENFTFLTPGVTGTQWAKYVNGSPSFAQEVIIDGIGTQDIGAPGFVAESTPPYEAVSEFKVQNGLYPAEYGNALGVENYTLRSGTNKFHGDLFEFIRSAKLDAAGYFTPESEKPPLHQNEFGFTVGGPLAVTRKSLKSPHKTYFFAAFSGFTLSGGLPSSSLVTVPSMQERTGNFSDYPFPVYDPATQVYDPATGLYIRQPFPGNIIPQARFSAIAQRIVALIPPPDYPGYVNNYYNRSSSPTYDYDYSIKIDRTLTDKQQLSGSLWQVNSKTTLNGPLTGPLNPGYRITPTHALEFRLNHTYTITPTLLNHIAFGWNSSQPTWSNWSTDPTDGNQTLKIPGIPADAPGWPTISMGGGNYQELGNSASNATLQIFRNWAITDDVTWVTGRQTIKWGFMYRRRTLNSHSLANEGGTFNFVNESTSNPADSTTYSTYGNGFASLLLGQVDSASAYTPAPELYFSDGLSAAYAEDSINIRRNLTATLGLRYELPNYATEKNGNVSLLSLTTPNPGANGLPGALIFLGNGAGRTGTFNIFGTYHKAFSPRVALVYSPDQKTAVRLGYGAFWLFPNYGGLVTDSEWTNGWGLSTSYASTNNAVTPAFSLDSGYPASGITLPDFNPTILNNGTAYHVDSQSNLPALTNSWTLSIQHQLPNDMLLDMAYVGSRTTHLPSGIRNPNQIANKWLSLGNELEQNISCVGTPACPLATAAGITAPYPGFTGSITQALHPYPQYETLYDIYQPSGYSQYESLQVRMQKRYSKGLSFLLSYTWSKNFGISNGSSFGDFAGSEGVTDFALDTFNPGAERSVLPQNQTNVLTMSGTYALPFGRGSSFFSDVNPVVNEIIGGWILNSVDWYESGTPLTITGGPAIPNGNFVGNRPNWNPQQGSGRSSTSMRGFNPSIDRYLISAPFSDPAPYTYGNAPPYQPNLSSPAYYDEDFSVLKRFHVRSDTRYFEFRAEFFNLLNRVEFGGPATDIDESPTFGVISSQANTPRVIQFGGKFIF